MLLRVDTFGSFTRGTILPRKYDDGSDIDYMIGLPETSMVTLLRLISTG